MNENIATKSIIGLFFGVSAYLVGRITELIVVLAFLMVIDYLSGLVYGLMEGSFDKNRGIRGAIKKVFYILIILVGFLGDFTINYMVINAGFELPIKGILGFAVTIYLIGTEGFSCIQNFILLGLPVPSFLEKAFGLIRDQAGTIVKIQKKKEDEENENYNN